MWQLQEEEMKINKIKSKETKQGRQLITLQAPMWQKSRFESHRASVGCSWTIVGWSGIF